MEIKSTKFCLCCYHSWQRQFVVVGTEGFVIHISILKRRCISANFTALLSALYYHYIFLILLASYDNFPVHIDNSWYQNMSSLYPQHVQLLFNVSELLLPRIICINMKDGEKGTFIRGCEKPGSQGIKHLHFRIYYTAHKIVECSICKCWV
jgi:hypothetical protein